MRWEPDWESMIIDENQVVETDVNKIDVWEGMEIDVQQRIEPELSPMDIEDEESKSLEIVRVTYEFSLWKDAKSSCELMDYNEQDEPIEEGDLFQQILREKEFHEQHVS
jgi:hypothetical protein